MLIEELSLALFEVRKCFDAGKPHGYGLPVRGAGGAMQGSKAKTMAASTFGPMAPGTTSSHSLFHFLRSIDWRR